MEGESQQSQLTAEQLDAKITAWHDAPDESPEAKMQLHECLGWTWEQFKHWVKTGEFDGTISN